MAVSELGRRAKYYASRWPPRQLAVEAGEWERMSTAIAVGMKLRERSAFASDSTLEPSCLKTRNF